MCIHAVWTEWFLECKTTTVDLANLRESNSRLIKIILTFTQQFDWIIPDQFMNAMVFMTDNSFMEKTNQFLKKTIACASNEYDNYRGKTSLVLCDAMNWTGFLTGSMCVLFISFVRKIHVIAWWLYHQNLVQTHNMFLVFYSYKTNVGHPPVFRNLLNQNRGKKTAFFPITSWITAHHHQEAVLCAWELRKSKNLISYFLQIIAASVFFPHIFCCKS